MRHIPEQYEWEQGDVLVALRYDAVWIKTNNGWGSSNGTSVNDEIATKLIKNNEAVYGGNRRSLK